jgi:hypothetical protein
MWYAIYYTATGILASETSVEPGNLPAPQAYKTYASKPSDSLMWDTVTRDYIARPAGGVVDRMVDLETHVEFVDFQTGWGALNAANKQRVRNGIIKMLGSQRFRDTNEPVIMV